MREIEKMTLASENLVSTRLIQLKKLMPEAFSEGALILKSCAYRLAMMWTRARSAMRSHGLARPTPSVSRRL